MQNYLATLQNNETNPGAAILKKKLQFFHYPRFLSPGTYIDAHVPMVATVTTGAAVTTISAFLLLIAVSICSEYIIGIGVMAVSAGSTQLVADSGEAFVLLHAGSALLQLVRVTNAATILIPVFLLPRLQWASFYP